MWVIEQGLRPGDSDWERWGICEHITKPRIDAAITGKTPGGEPIKGDYQFTDPFPMACGFEDGGPGGEKLAARLAGVDVPAGFVSRVSVRQEAGLVDAATFVLEGPKGLRLAARLKLGDDARVQARPRRSPATLFKGEIVGIEPVLDPTHPLVTVRAFNRLHRLTRGPRSRTFVDRTDGEIVEEIASDNGLEALVSGDLPLRYDLVVQADQTDLEFLRVRAARIGYEVLVDGTTLLFRKQQEPPTLRVGCHRRGGALKLRLFYARLSTSRSVQKVVVRGFDPSGAEHVGEAQAPTVLLEPGEFDSDRLLGQTVELTVDQPIFSAEEANAIAKAKLGELTLSYLSGEALLGGTSRLRAESLVELQGVGDRFDGKYFVQGVTHRYSHGGVDRGYKSVLRVRQDAEFYLSDVDDDVLVAFEQGDLRRPVIVGSLWDDDDPPD
jgi:phage protein D